MTRAVAALMTAASRVSGPVASRVVMMIRRMKSGEELAVSELLCECYRWVGSVERYSQRQVAFLVEERGSLRTVQEESRDQSYLVACSGDTVVGVVAVAGGVIAKLYVAPLHHGEGIGTALFEAAEASAQEAGFSRLTLGTTPHAVGFYERRGMSVAARRLHDAGVFRGRETVLMEKALRSPAGA